MADIQFIYNSIVEDDCFGMAVKEDKLCKQCGAYDMCRDIVGKAEEQEVVKRIIEETPVKGKETVVVLDDEEVVEKPKKEKAKKAKKDDGAYNSLVTPFINYLNMKDKFEYVDKGLQGLAAQLNAKTFLTVKSYKKPNTKYNIVFTAAARGIPGVTERVVTAAYTQQVYEGSSFEELQGIVEVYYKKVKGAK